MALDVALPLRAHRGAQRAIPHDQLQRLGEFPPVGIEQTGVAPPAMLDGHLGPRIGQDRRAHRERLERQQERLSYGDGTTTTVAASSACRRSASGRMPAKRTPRILGQGHQLGAHEHESRVAALVEVGAGSTRAAPRTLDPGSMRPPLSTNGP